MNWKIRHQGSPKSVENMTLEQIAEGLQDGLWEPTDEVQGPRDNDWVIIENHPLLEELAADLEPPPPKSEPDESRLDMTPLIDVCLVLLIFMVLTISYGAIQKQLEAASLASDKPTGPIKKTKDVIEQTMIIVKADVENGKTVIRIEDKIVDEENLFHELGRFVRDTRKVELLIQPGPGVRRKTIVAIQDAAGRAQMTKIHVLANQP